MRALLAAANCIDVECNQESWQAFCSMSWFNASFPMIVAMVSRHARTVNEMSVVCLLFPKIASCSGCNVMISHSLMAALKRKGVG